MPLLSKTGGAALRSWGFNFPSNVSAQVATGYWPAAYETLINSSNYVKFFINQSMGSDTNDGLTEVTPFATFNKFIAVTKNLPTSIMAVIYPGNYTITPWTTNTDSMYADNNHPRLLVGYPKTTTLNYLANQAVRDCPLFLFQNAKSKMYGLILKRDNNGRTANYSNAFLYGFGYFQGNVYNCVFEEDNANNSWSIGYANTGWPVTSVNFCTFAVRAAGMGDYSGGTGLHINNCLFNWTYTSTPSTVTNCEFSTAHTMNFTTYKITDYTPVTGVYNGTYAWPA